MIENFMKMKCAAAGQLLLVCLLAMSFSVPSMAATTYYNFSVKNEDGVTIYYLITSSDEDNPTVGVGRPSSSYGAYTDAVINVPETVTDPDSGTTYTVTSLEDNAFRACSSIETVSLPETITSWGSNMFYQCTSLSEINIPSGVTSLGIYAFSGCSNLTELELPENLTSISSYAFYNCGLTSIEIPDGVSSMGEYVCASSTSLVTANIPSGTTSVPECAFRDCTGLTTISLHDNLTKIGQYAFYQCTSLTSISLPSSLTTINAYAFYGSGLTSLVIPNNVSSLGGTAVDGCTSLESVTIGASLTSIDFTSNFYRCTALTKFIVAEGNTTYKAGKDGTLLSYDGSTLVFYPAGKDTSYTVSGVTAIGAVAFYCNSAIEEVAMDSGVTSIGESAFYKCTSLKAIALGDGVTTVGNNAFAYCSAAETLTLDDNLTTIGNSAFQKCTSITEVTIPALVTSLGTNLFVDCSSLATVYYNAVSCETAGAYYNPIFNSCTALTTVVIGDGVEIIPAYLCCNCSKLTSITIGTSVESIGTQAFYGCSSLAAFTMNGESQYYCVDDGVLYTADKTLIVQYPEAKSPDGIVSVDMAISDYAFSGNTKITSITIGEDVTSIGLRAFENCTALTTVIFNADSCATDVTSDSYCPFYGCTKIDSVSFGENVTAIPEYLFYANHSSKFTNLKTITIPASVKSIGKYAFYYCSSVTSLTIGSGVETIGDDAFYYLSSIDSIAIPNSVRTIGSEAFGYCSAAKSVTIGTGLESIGAKAFYDCTGLTTVTFNAVNCSESLATSGKNCPFYLCTNIETVTFGDDVTIIPAALFEGDGSGYKFTTIVIPDNVKTIGNSAFLSCSTITSLTIGSGVETIGSSAFQSCSGITTLTIPESVTEISSSAFRSCTGITELSISKNVSHLGTYAFQGCSSLESLNYDAAECTADHNQGGWTGAQDAPFYNLGNLETVTIGENVESMSDNLFRNCTGLDTLNFNAACCPTLGNYTFGNCNNLETVNFGDKVTIVPAGFMYGGNSNPNLKKGYLKSITIPDNVQAIGNNAFAYQDSLKHVTMGAELDSIASYAFHYCTSLEEVVLPDKVTYVGDDAFAYCGKIKEVTVGEGVTYLGSDVFEFCTSIKRVNYNAKGSETGKLFGFASVFQFADSLELVTIGSNVENIPDGLFKSNKCKNLVSFAKVPPRCDNTDTVTSGLAGFDKDSCWLIVPEDAEIMYANTTPTYSLWKKFKKRREMTVTIKPEAQDETGDYFYSTRFSPYSYTLDEGLEGGVISGITTDEDGTGHISIDWKYSGDDPDKAVVPEYTALIVRDASGEEHVNYTVATGEDDESEDDDEDDGEDESEDGTKGAKARKAEATSAGNLLHGNYADGIYYYAAYDSENIKITPKTDIWTYVGDDYSDENVAAEAEEYYFYKLTFGNDGTEYADVLGFYWAASGSQTYNHIQGGPFKMSTGKHTWLAIPRAAAVNLASIPLREAVETDSSADLETGAESEETTGIASFASDDVGEKTIYNLAGQRVNDMNRRGVYIVNGRKVVKK